MPEGGSIQIVAENIHIDENYVTMNKKARLGFYVIIRRFQYLDRVLAIALYLQEACLKPGATRLDSQPSSL